MVEVKVYIVASYKPGIAVKAAHESEVGRVGRNVAVSVIDLYCKVVGAPRGDVWGDVDYVRRIASHV